MNHKQKIDPIHTTGSLNTFCLIASLKVTQAKNWISSVALNGKPQRGFSFRTVVHIREQDWHSGPQRGISLGTVVHRGEPGFGIAAHYGEPVSTLWHTRFCAKTYSGEIWHLLVHSREPVRCPWTTTGNYFKNEKLGKD
jgi:hypothetical protein